MGILTISPDALNDVLGTVKAFRIWNLLAVQDIRQRYRRSTLGPFWLTLSMFVSIAALALVYTKIFKVPTADYLPFLSVGFVAWSFISSLLMDSCATFISAEGIIKQINLPFGVHVMRMVWRNLITLFHHCAALVVVLVYAEIQIRPEIILLPLSLALTAVTGVFTGYIFGGLCARFRDITQIITSLTQVIFYVTPVIWQPALLKGHENLLEYNPFFHYVEIMRIPILGGSGNFHSWWICLSITFVLGVVSMAFMTRFKRRIAFWV